MAELGHDVLAIDARPENVQALSGSIAHVVQADATDLETPKQLGVADFRHAVVAIGQDLEASVLTILNLSQMGVRDIWATDVRAKHGVTVVGIKRRHEDFIYAREDTEIRAGDLLIVAGPTRAVERFAARV